MYECEDWMLLNGIRIEKRKWSEWIGIRERERGGEQERILHMDCKQYIQAKEQWHVKYIAIKWYYVIIKLKKYTTLNF